MTTESGGFRDSVILGRITEAEASAIAQDYADLWSSWSPKIALIIVPDVDDGSRNADWQGDQIQIVKELRGRPVSPAERQTILRRTYAWQTDE